MLTKIEIDGFKTFKDFSVELAPFQVIVGPNGSGKSNLFDALQLLSRVASMDLYEAFQGLRGEAHELFTIYPDGKKSEVMHFAVELITHREGPSERAAMKVGYRRFRYEVEIARGIDETGLDQLYIRHEQLKLVPWEQDKWSEKYKIRLYRTLFEQDATELQYFQKEVEDIHTEKSSYTALCTSKSLYAEILKRELQSFRFFHLNPIALRQFSSATSPRFLAPDGSNLPAALARIQSRDKYAVRDISWTIGRLVPGIFNIKVERVQPTDQYIIQADTTDKRTLTSQVLSDGTLRLLALATLRSDPALYGVICIEEPEDGIDPLHLPDLAVLLRRIATDFSDPKQTDRPLRQVIVTSHSPTFIGLPDIIDSLLFAVKPTRVGGGELPIQVTRMAPVITSVTNQPDEERDVSLENYSISQIQKYLDSDSQKKAQKQLDKARKLLHEKKIV